MVLPDSVKQQCFTFLNMVKDVYKKNLAYNKTAPSILKHFRLKKSQVKDSFSSFGFKAAVKSVIPERHDIRLVKH